MARPPIDQLAGILWREREVLEVLVEHLGAAAVAASAGLTTQGLLRSIRSLELHRAITAREVAAELGLIGEPTLSRLIRQGPPEWAVVLGDHHRSLRSLVHQVGSLARARMQEGEGCGQAVLLPVRAPRMIQRSLREFLA